MKGLRPDAEWIPDGPSEQERSIVPCWRPERGRGEKNVFVSGQWVLVIRGAFEGLLATVVVPANSDGGICRVRLRLWDQDVTVELPPGWLAAVEEEGPTDDDADRPFVRFDQTPP